MSLLLLFQQDAPGTSSAHLVAAAALGASGTVPPATSAVSRLTITSALGSINGAILPTDIDEEVTAPDGLGPIGELVATMTFEAPPAALTGTQTIRYATSADGGSEIISLAVKQGAARLELGTQTSSFATTAKSTSFTAAELTAAGFSLTAALQFEMSGSAGFNLDAVNYDARYVVVATVPATAPLVAPAALDAAATVVGPANLLTADQATFEGAATGWVSDGSTLTTSATVASQGAQSLRSQASAAAAYNLRTSPNVPITPGAAYSGMVDVRAGTVGRTCEVRLQWWLDGVFVSQAFGSLVTTTTTGWQQIVVQASAPATGVNQVSLSVQVGAGAAGEFQYLDRAAVVAGTSATWSAPVAPAGAQAGLVAPAQLGAQATPTRSAQASLVAPAALSAAATLVQPASAGLLAPAVLGAAATRVQSAAAQLAAPTQLAAPAVPERSVTAALLAPAALAAAATPTRLVAAQLGAPAVLESQTTANSAAAAALLAPSALAAAADASAVGAYFTRFTEYALNSSPADWVDFGPGSGLTTSVGQDADGERFMRIQKAASGTDGLVWTDVPAAADVEVYAEFQSNSTSTLVGRGGPLLRADIAAGTGYVAEHGQTLRARILEYQPAIATLAESTGVTNFPAGTRLRVRARVVTSGANAVVSVKVWEFGTVEPAAFTVTFTDVSPRAAGQVGWFSFGSGTVATDTKLYAFGVAVGGGTARHTHYADPIYKQVVDADVAYPFADDVTVTDLPTGDFDDPRDAGTRVHRGKDLHVPMGTPVYAMVGGTVHSFMPGSDGVITIGSGLGYAVQVNSKKVRYTYGHLGPQQQNAQAQAFAPGIAPGTVVVKGQLLGWSGDSGASDSGPHLHIDWRDLAGDVTDDPTGDYTALLGSEAGPRFDPIATLLVAPKLVRGVTAALTAPAALGANATTTAGTLTVPAAAALTAPAALGAPPTVDRPAAAALTAPAVLGTAGVVTRPAAVQLAAPVVLGSGALVTDLAVAALVAPVAVVAAARADVAVAAALLAPAVLQGAVLGDGPAAAPLTAPAVLLAAATVTVVVQSTALLAPAVLAGTAPVLRPSAAGLLAPAALTAAALPSRLAAAALAAPGALTASALGTRFAATALLARAVLDVSLQGAPTAAAGLVAPAALQGSGAVARLAAAQLLAPAALTASLVATRSASALLLAPAALTAATVPVRAATAGLLAPLVLTGAGVPERPAQAHLVAALAFAATAVSARPAAADLLAPAAVTGALLAARSAVAQLVAPVVVTGSPLVVRAAAAALVAPAVLAALAVFEQPAAAGLVAPAILTGQATLGRVVAADLGAAVALAALLLGEQLLAAGLEAPAALTSHGQAELLVAAALTAALELLANPDALGVLQVEVINLQGRYGPTVALAVAVARQVRLRGQLDGALRLQGVSSRSRSVTSPA